MCNLLNIDSISQTAKRLLPALTLGLVTSTGYAADLTVTVTEIEQTGGEILLALYDNAGDFQKTAAQASRREAVAGELTFQFPDLSTGDYAILVFHDINGNGKLDSNLMGMPTEPWGASLQGKKIFGAPGWEDTKFEVTDTGTNVTVKLN